MESCITDQTKEHGFNMQKVVQDQDIGGGLQGCIYKLTWQAAGNSAVRAKLGQEQECSEGGRDMRERGEGVGEGVS